MMNTTQKAGWVALVSAMAATGAHAQEGGFTLGDVEVAEEKPFLTSEFEIGVGYVTEDSYKFGQFNGLEDDGPFVIGNMKILRRGPYDGEDARYWRAHGNNLGLDNRDLQGEYGKQGSYKASAFYDRIPHNRFDDGVTIYNGAGGNNLTLPAGWPGGVSDLTDPAATTAISNFSQPLKIKHERENYGAGIDYSLGRHWSVDFKAQREDRDGSKLTAGIFGSNGGNPAAVLIPEPVDYTTDRVDAGLNYTGKQAQLRLAYSGSFFQNKNSNLRWDNLFTGGQPGGGAWDDPVPDAGQLSLAPDSQAHYLSLNGAYNVSPMTRLHGQVRYSMMLQDDNFLPYTINPDLTNPALPRNSLDGDLRELLVDLAADSRITNKLSVRGTLRYRDSENKTPRDTYTVVHNDAVNTAGGSDNRVNLPYEFTQTKLGLEGTYRLGMMTKLRGGYRFERMERNLQEVDETDEHSVFARLSGNIRDNTQGWLEYTRSQRDGDGYDTGKPFREGHTAAYLATLTPGCTDPAVGPTCENHPALRKYHEADRDRDDLTGVLNWFNDSGLSVGLRATFTKDDYDAELGLAEQQTTRFSIEPAYQMGDLLTAYGYYTYEQLEYDQNGHDFVGFGAGQNFTNPAQRWSIDTTDKIHTLGVGLTRKKFVKNTDLVLEYAYSDATTEMASAAGSANTPVDLPDLKSKLHRFSMGIDYAYKEHLTYRFRYAYEDYDTDDFALDGTGLVAGDDVLGVGTTSPDYSAHVFGISMLYKFE